MIKFIKRLFGEKPAISETIRLGDARDWFGKETEPELEALKAGLRKRSDAIKEKKEECKRALDTLQSAKLTNEQIAQRAKDIMEGNRKSFIRKTQELLMKIEPAEDPEKSEIEDFKSLMKEYSDSTAKSYFVLQEFFANESKAVALLIKEIDSSMHEQRRAVLESKYGQIAGVTEAMRDYNNQAKSKKHLLSDALDLENEISKLIEQLADNETRLIQLRNSDEMQGYNSLLEEKAKEEKAVRDSAEELKALVVGLEPALRKIQKGLDYVQDPDLVFKDTERFRLLALEVKAFLDKDPGDLSEKRQERARVSAEKAMLCEELQARYAAAKEKSTKLSQDILRNSSLQDYTELEYKSTHIRNRLEETKKELQVVKQTIGKIDLDASKEKLRSLMSQCLLKEITFA